MTDLVKPPHFKLNPEGPFFPIVRAAIPTKDGVLLHDIVGGLSVREGIAVQALQGLLSNPALAGIQNADTYAVLALKATDRLLAHINSELPPEQPENVTPLKPAN